MWSVSVESFARPDRILRSGSTSGVSTGGLLAGTPAAIQNMQAFLAGQAAGGIPPTTPVQNSSAAASNRSNATTSLTTKLAAATNTPAPPLITTPPPNSAMGAAAAAAAGGGLVVSGTIQALETLLVRPRHVVICSYKNDLIDGYATMYYSLGTKRVS